MLTYCQVSNVVVFNLCKNRSKCSFLLVFGHFLIVFELKIAWKDATFLIKLAWESHSWKSCILFYVFWIFEVKQVIYNSGIFFCFGSGRYLSCGVKIKKSCMNMCDLLGICVYVCANVYDEQCICISETKFCLIRLNRVMCVLVCMPMTICV